MQSVQSKHEVEIAKNGQEIAAKIAALQPPVSDEHVLAVLQQQECSPDLLCSTFWLLDNEPTRFADHQTWHPRLRSLRNHPTAGERMFALFR